MKNRLELACKLLRDDGVIFVQCDDNEQAYLKVLMDSVYGEENFINCISVKMSTPSGLKMSHIDKKIIKTKEYILAFSKNSNIVNLNPQYEIKDEYDWEYGFLLNKNNSEEVSDWKVEKLKDVLVREGIISTKNESISMNDSKFKEFYLENASLIWARGRHHNIPKDIYELSKINKDTVYEYHNGDTKQYAYRGRRMAFLDRTVKLCIDKSGNFTNDIAIAVCDFWSFVSTAKLFSEGGIEFNNGKKPELILNILISMVTNKDDIVLDFHLGSGTTAAVAHKMNRRYIGVEQIENQIKLSLDRLSNVIDGEQGGISKAVDWQGGGSFVYCELMEN